MKDAVIILAVIVFIIGIYQRFSESVDPVEEPTQKPLPTHLQWVEDLINETLKIKQ